MSAAVTPLATDRRDLLVSPLASAPRALEPVEPPLPTFPPATRQGLTYHDLASSRLGRAKLWLHYGLLYRWLHYVPASWREAMTSRSTRLLHGPVSSSEDLRCLIEYGLAWDDTTT